MKNLIYISLLILVLSSCKTEISYIQLYETQAINSSEKNNANTYENDTLKIAYLFWADKGQMRFSIYNKTLEPLYIDWFKSSYISNSSAKEYLKDKHRIGFIPPKSYISFNAEYPLVSSHYSKWGKDYTQKTEPRTDNPKVNTTISSKQFTKENSPWDFRNYLTFSFNENFSNQFSIDNEYYVKAISVMDVKQFWDSIPQNGNSPTTRFEKSKDFYVKVK